MQAETNPIAGRGDQAPHDNDERLQSAMDAAHIFAWDWDLKTGARILSQNARNVFGIDSKRIESFHLLAHPDDKSRIDAALNRALAGESDYDLEYRLVLDGGRTIWVRDAGRVAFDKAGKPLRMEGVCSDITRRKRAESALTESEGRFRLTFEQAAVGMAHVGLDGRFLRVNEKLCEMLGYSRAELMQRSFLLLAHSENLQADIAMMRGMLSGQVPMISREKRFVRKDKSVLWINLTASFVKDSFGKVQYGVAIVEDIGARKLAEDEVRQSRERLLQALESAHMFAWDWKATDGVITFSPNASSILGVATTELRSLKDCERIIDSRDRRRLRNYASLVTAGNKDEYSVELRIAGAKNSVRWIHNQGRVVRGRDGQVQSVAGITRDITERKNAEAKIRRLNRALARRAAAVLQQSRRILQAQEAERRRVARELHDGVNQMLSSAMFRLKSLTDFNGNQRRRRDLEKTRTILDQAIQETRRISQNLRPALLDDLGLVAAVRSVCEDFSERTGVRVQFHAPELGRFSRGDTAQTLYRIVQEALNNVERHALAKNVNIDIMRTRHRLKLSIKDDGRGFKKKVLRKRPDKSGFGLYNMQERAGFAGGTFAIRSLPGTGTRILVSIPVARNKKKV